MSLKATLDYNRKHSAIACALSDVPGSHLGVMQRLFHGVKGLPRLREVAQEGECGGLRARRSRVTISKCAGDVERLNHA